MVFIDRQKNRWIAKCKGSILRLGEWCDTSPDDNCKTGVVCDKFRISNN